MIKAVLTVPPDQEGGPSYFEGPKEFIAKKRQASGQATTTSYELRFSPKWVTEQVAHLALNNIETHETYEYELTGVADEPLAEDHVAVKCTAREKTVHEFAVQNFSGQEAEFEVESDILHISGPSTVAVPANGSGVYLRRR